jgi:hypothetical protein
MPFTTEVTMTEPTTCSECRVELWNYGKEVVILCPLHAATEELVRALDITAMAIETATATGAAYSEGLAAAHKIACQALARVQAAKGGGK